MNKIEAYYLGLSPKTMSAIKTFTSGIAKMNDRLRCDDCGKYISYTDIETGKAGRRMITPDSEFTAETYETLCSKCMREDK